jgi:transaldolase / glucose-6-phosphate isomerase
MTNPAFAVQQLGQSLWLDYIHRDELNDGRFARRLEQEGIVGVTSNPSIFQKSIGESSTYDDAIHALVDHDTAAIYESLAIEDIQSAADLLLPIYGSSAGRDGYVSLEVPPQLASDTASTVDEARRLFDLVNRPNVMIKIPATPEGLPAIEASIADGININITLIFSLEVYGQVVDAYIRGLEKRLAVGLPVDGIASVASFFLSRIDLLVDEMVEGNIRMAQVHGDTDRIAANSALLGQAAIASAKLAYQHFQRVFEGERFAALRAAGAQVQRPLWASTSTKNPAYPDTRYVDALIGRDTVNTLPPATLTAFVDHGTVAETVNRELDGDLPPATVMAALAEQGIDMGYVTQRLLDNGLESFQAAFDKLMEQIDGKRMLLKTGVLVGQKAALGIYADSVQAAVDRLARDYTNARLWDKDGSLWSDNGPTIQKIQNRLGWLDVLESIDYARLKDLRASMENGPFDHIVLLGMGGSSLAPEVMSLTFGQQPGFPQLLVLDSTDPARIAAVEAAIDLERTLFVSASKSGGTIETLSFTEYFFARCGGDGSRFIAITDPGSQLASEATARGFRDVFLNPADIGGRYSALSYFGLVPAALIGLDLDRIRNAAERMINACAPSVTAANHPALTVGAIMGTLGLAGRDKVVITATQSMASFGNWVEQLVAESTGKDGRGLVPVVGDRIGSPRDYADDRLFVHYKLPGDGDAHEVGAAVKALRKAGYPRISLHLDDRYDLFGEFFRWEYATAIAGILLEVNPFDEPNVTEAKEATRSLIAHYEQHGALPKGRPVMADDGIQLYATEATLAPLGELADAHGYKGDSPKRLLAALLASARVPDYIAFLAYFTPDAEAEAILAEARFQIRHVTHRAVTLGYGPRYLHSTGQLHKGGPNTGIFIQLTTENAPDIVIPDAAYSFGVLFNAQAAGDWQALTAHGRRAIRLHLTGDRHEGLRVLVKAAEFLNKRRR